MFTPAFIKFILKSPQTHFVIFLELIYNLNSFRNKSWIYAIEMSDMTYRRYDLNFGERVWEVLNWCFEENGKPKNKPKRSISEDLTEII